MPKIVVKVPLETLMMSTISTAVCCSGATVAQARAEMRAFVENDRAWRALEIGIPRLSAAAADPNLTTAIAGKPPTKG